MTVGTSITCVILGVTLNFVLHERFIGNSSLIIALLIFSPRLLYQGTHLREHMSANAVGVIECLLIGIVAISGFGSFGLYREFYFYDMIAHIINPIFIGIGLSIIIGSYTDSRNPSAQFLTQLWTALFTIAIIVLWEVYEFGGDQLFGTQMFGQSGEAHDTLYDIVMGIFSLIIVYLFNRYYLRRLLIWLKQ